MISDTKMYRFDSQHSTLNPQLQRKLQINQMDRLYIKKPAAQTVHVDMGYRGHDYQGDKTVIVDKRRRGATAKRIWR
mgnify:CR=1 FL=1